MKVRFSAATRAELRDAIAYIADRNPAAARRVRDAIVRDAGTLAEFPLRGQRIEGTNLRRLVRGNYLIFYEVSATFISISRVIHGARLAAADPEREDGA